MGAMQQIAGSYAGHGKPELMVLNLDKKKIPAQMDQVFKLLGLSTKISHAFARPFKGGRCVKPYRRRYSNQNKQESMGIEVVRNGRVYAFSVFDIRDGKEIEIATFDYDQHGQLVAGMKRDLVTFEWKPMNAMYPVQLVREVTREGELEWDIYLETPKTR